MRLYTTTALALVAASLHSPALAETADPGATQASPAQPAANPLAAPALPNVSTTIATANEVKDRAFLHVDAKHVPLKDYLAAREGAKPKELPANLVRRKKGGTGTPKGAATTNASETMTAAIAGESYRSAAATAAEPPTDIDALARALKHDPDLIYEFVRDNIEVTPVYGIQKGAWGTLIDRQGSNFDQVELFVRLLRASGYQADFMLGVIQLSAAQVQSYFGISTGNTLAVRDYFSSGQTPSEFYFTGTTADSPLDYALFQHMWARVTINGQQYMFDPSLKAHTVKPGIGVASAAGYSQAAYLASAKEGATVTATSARNLNRANVRDDLAGYANGLIANIRANTPAAGLDDIIGGKSITQNERLTAAPTRDTTLPVARMDYGGNIFTGEIPTDFRTIVQVVFNGANVAFLADDFYGARLTVAPNANNELQLIADGEVIATGNQLPIGFVSPLQVSIQHLAYSTINADQTIGRPMHGGETFAISYALGASTNRLSKRYREQAAAASAAGNADRSEAVFGAQLAALGADLHAQMAMSTHLVDRAANANTQLHHTLGLINQHDGAPNINFTMSHTAVQQDLDESRRLAAVIAQTMHGSALESGVLEQTLKVPAVSTIHFIDKAVADGETIYSATAANYDSEVVPNLVGCSSQEIAGLRTYMDAGWRLVLPNNCDQAEGDWVGSGVLAMSPDPNNLSIGMQISGGYNGGFSSRRNVSLVPSQMRRARSDLKRARKLRGDPVDMATGGFAYSHDDILVGSGAHPEALGIVKTYHSDAAAFDGPLGRGWSHNYAMQVRRTTDPYQGLGEDSPIDAAVSIVEAMIAVDLLSDPLLPFDKLTVAMLGNRWWADQLNNNAVSVSTDIEGSLFVQLPDGTFNAPPANSSKLIQNPDGSFTQSLVDKSRYEFDASGNVSAWKNPAGMEVRFGYTDGKLTTVQNSLGRSLSLTYAGNRISSVEDGTGRSVSYGYDAAGNLANFTDAAGKLTSFEYDQPGRMAKFFLPANPAVAQVQNVYDNLGRVAQQTDADGKLWQYFIAGTRSELVSPMGNRAADYFDGEGRVLATVEDINSSAGSKGHWQQRQTVNFYDGLGRQVKRIDSREPMIQISYDDASCNGPEKRCTNNVLTRRQTAVHTSDSVAALADIVSSFTYEPNFNKVASVTDGRGKTTNFSYDPANGNLISVTRPPAADGGTLRPQTSYTYSSFAGAPGFAPFTLPTSETRNIDAASSVTTTVSYDAANHHVLAARVVDSGGLNLATSYGYDTVGNLTSIDGPRNDVGDVTQMGYDAERRLTSVTDAHGKQTRTLHNDDGDVIGTASQIGAQWSATCYDRLPSGKILRVVGPARVASLGECPAAAAPNSVVDLAYDGDGRLQTNTVNLAGIEGGNRVTGFEYTPSGELVATNKAVGSPLEQSDPKVSIFYSDRTTSSTFDATTDYRLFSANNAGRGTDPGSKTLALDGHGRLKHFWPGGNSCPDTSSGYGCEQYEYDGNGNVTKWTRRDGGVFTFSYDNLNRVIQKKSPTRGGDVDYGYDLLGRIQSASQGRQGDSVAYTYDKAGRLLSESLAGRTVSYQYDEAGNRTRVAWPEGDLAVTYQHDALGRVTAIRENGSSLLASYSYDDLSRRTAVTYGNGTTIGYDYDAQERLASQTHDLAGTAGDVTRTYGHDQAGGITSIATSNDTYDWNGYYDVDRPYTNDGEDLYLTSGAKTLTYDARGNLIGDGTWTFEFDADNRLTNANVKGQVKLVYGYDALSRLSRRTFAKDVASYLYEGDQLIGEYGYRGALARRYVRGPGEDEPIVIYEGPGTDAKSWLYADHLGSVTASADASGNPVAAMSYGPFGEPNSTTGIELRYTGQMLDPDTGLYYYKARWYSPYMGRFLSPDPIGVDDGMHLYTYVGNDPINYLDPLGLNKHDLCKKAESSSSDFNDQIIADENSVFDSIGKIGDAAQAVGYVAAPLNPAVGGVLILGGKIASNASTVIEVGTGIADYLKNGNTGQLANSAGGAIGGVIAGQYGKKVGKKIFGNEQIRDSLGRYGEKRSTGVKQIGQTLGDIAGSKVCN